MSVRRLSALTNDSVVFPPVVLLEGGISMPAPGPQEFPSHIFDFVVHSYVMGLRRIRGVPLQQDDEEEHRSVAPLASLRSFLEGVDR